MDSGAEQDSVRISIAPPAAAEPARRRAAGAAGRRSARRQHAAPAPAPAAPAPAPAPAAPAHVPSLHALRQQQMRMDQFAHALAGAQARAAAPAARIPDAPPAAAARTPDAPPARRQRVRTTWTVGLSRADRRLHVLFAGEDAERAARRLRAEAALGTDLADMKRELVEHNLLRLGSVVSDAGVRAMFAAARDVGELRSSQHAARWHNASHSAGGELSCNM